jgi:hypothetical protein
MPVSVVRMTSVVEVCATVERRSFCFLFLGKKGHNVKYIHKEIFPVYSGKSLSRKAFHKWVEKFYEGRLKVADDARQSKDFYAEGFRY